MPTKQIKCIKVEFPNTNNFSIIKTSWLLYPGLPIDDKVQFDVEHERDGCETHRRREVVYVSDDREKT